MKRDLHAEWKELGAGRHLQKEHSSGRGKGGLQKRGREVPQEEGETGEKHVKIVTDSEVIDRKAGNLHFCLFWVVPFGEEPHDRGQEAVSGVARLMTHLWPPDRAHQLPEARQVSGLGTLSCI